jgi:hypothetical protein
MPRLFRDAQTKKLHSPQLFYLPPRRQILVKSGPHLTCTVYTHTANNFRFIYSQKDLGKPYFISTIYLHNRTIIFYSELCYSVEKYTRITRCSHSAVRIANNLLWKDNSNLMEEIYISELELQTWSLEFVLSFSKIYIRILEWGLLIPFGSM